MSSPTPRPLQTMSLSLLLTVTFFGRIVSASVVAAEDHPLTTGVLTVSTVAISPAPPALRRPCNMFARKSCICRMNFKPLCGSDGITYANLCQFHCAQRCEPGLNFERCGTCWQSGTSSRACLTA